jgi:predicted SAM-dependent methyltransferase
MAIDRSVLARRVAQRASSASNYVAFWIRRRAYALSYIRGTGLEIGAMDLPLRVRRGVEVRYVDRTDIDGLRAHYPEAGPRLVDVDIVDDGETLATQADESADFVIANHVIEHTEDPLATIANWLRVVRKAGIVYIGVPDRRKTFDCERAPTSLDHVVRDYEDGASWSRSRHLEEWAQFVLDTPVERLADRVRALDEQNYSIHYHVWDRLEFGTMLDYARTTLGLPFTIQTIAPNSHEFIVVLRRT